MDDVWEYAADLGASSGLALQVSLTPARRRHMWRIVVRALDVVDGRPAAVRLQHSVEWPQADYTGFAAAILQAVSHLSLRLEEDALQQPQ